MDRQSPTSTTRARAPSSPTFGRTDRPRPTTSITGSATGSARAARLVAWLAGLGDRLVTVDIEGTAAYVVREDVDSLVAARPSDAVRFLPGHDQWVMGPGTKDAHVTPRSRRDLVTRKANPVIVGGVVCGTWARKGDELMVSWLDERRRPVRALEEEAGRLAGILDRDLRLTLTYRLASCCRHA